MSETVIGTLEDDTPAISIKELQDLYNHTKKTDTEVASKLSGDHTLRGIDGIDTLIAEAMVQIEAFVNKGREKSTASKVGSKALSIFDTKNGLFRNWLSGRKENLTKEDILDSSIPEVIHRLKTNIEAKREDVINILQLTASVRTDMLTKINIYENIKNKATKALESISPTSREALDAKLLVTMSAATVQQIYNDLKSDIEPLMAAANIAIDQIHQILPTIEHNLQSKLSIKSFQQRLSDLNSMVKGASDLAINAGKIISEDVHNTVYQSLSLLSETGIDVKALKEAQDTNFKHQEKLNGLMKKTAEKVHSDFVTVQQISNNLLSHKEANADNLIEQYADTNTNT